MNRHRGQKVQVYLNAADMDKLDALKPFSLRGTRSDTIRMLIRGTPLIDRSFREAVSALGKIGGLIKKNRLLPPDQLKALQDQVYELRRTLYGGNNH